MSEGTLRSELIHESVAGDRDAHEARRLNVIHFNDVYNIESRETEPVGGSARFVTAVEQLLHEHEHTPTIVLFSGDAISPSSLSMLVKGKQMIEVLNTCHVNAACLGNHDFDFGMDVLETHIKNSNFPWLLSNVFDAETKQPLGNVNDKHIIEIGGLKIGVIALVECEWIETLSTINFDEVIYESYVDVARSLTHQLKQEHKCDFVIALTHMRWNNDILLAEQVPEVDIFLGGHDHDYVVKQISDKWVVKSGTDFREFTFVQMSSNGANAHVDRIEKFLVDAQIKENEHVKAIVSSYLDNMNQELDVILGSMNTELEGRFALVRTQETNLGNFICDVMLEAVNADCAFLNSGSLRSDCIHSIGDFRVRDLKKILPYLDESVVISVTGAQLHQALENGVSQYPNLEGRFLQVSGIRFAFDPKKPSGQRIDPKLIQVQDEPIDLKKEYSVVTKTYLKQGKDGFDCLINCPVLIEDENIPVLYNLVENHFKTIEKLKRTKIVDRFRSSIVPLFIVNQLMNKLSEDPTVLKQENEPASAANAPSSLLNKMNFQNAAFLITKVLSHKQKVLSKLQRRIIKQSDKYKQKMKEYEEKSMRLEPRLEDRIICIQNPDHLTTLFAKFGLKD